MTIGQAYNLFLERAKLKSTSLRNYKTQYKAYIKKYEDMSVTDITDSFARGFLKSLGRLQINSIIEAKCVFTSVLNEAIKEGVILTHPFKDIKIRKTPPIRRPQPFTVEEIQAIMEAAEKEGWFVNFLAFLLLTGMRIGEALALHWENIKKDKIVITKSIYHGVIDTTKTNVARVEPTQRLY